MNSIHLSGVRQNNLKNIDVEIPIGSFTVICGPSGSGKSSLAFDTLFAEGQRRFIESMSNYSRQFLAKAPKPDVESVANIPPAVAIEQKNSVKSSRSTVGTTTEVLDHLRLLYEKLGTSHCPTHEIETLRHTPSEAAETILERFTDKRGYLLVKIDAETRSLTAKKLLSQIVEDGLSRLYVPSAATAKKATKKTKAKKTKKTTKVAKETKTDSLAGDVIEITPQLIKKGLPRKTFFLIVDRLAFKSSVQDRLVDSLEQAYELSLKYDSQLPAGQAHVLTTEGDSLKVSDFNTCALCDFTPPQISSGLFSFNNPIGACPNCKGFGNILDLDPQKVIPNDDLSINEGALAPFEMPSAKTDRRELRKFCDLAKIDRDKPWNKLTARQRKMIWEGTEDFYGVVGLFEYLEGKKYKMHVRVFLSRFKSPFECKVCEGSRLRPETKHILLKDFPIQKLSQMTVEGLKKTIDDLKFTKSELAIAKEPLRQVQSRLNFLLDVGVGYLSLSRETRSLSGGEYQRLILANQLGMGLSQSLYVLDEPTVGLHPRDNDRLIQVLKGLRDLGNTLVVVEHDHDVIQNSDHILEMGPGSGFKGGCIVYNGKTSSFYDFENSKTAPFLLNPQPPQNESRPVDSEKYKFMMELKDCKGHNLRKVSVKFPLNRLVCVTGVSGSGKSSLVTGTLYPAIAKKLGVDLKVSLPHGSLKGYDQLKNVSLIDQSSIGKTARSNPVTYMKIYDGIRQLMAETQESKVRGYAPGTFSLNVDGGRCPVCKGVGFEEIDMMFMDNVRLTCDACDGKKFRSEVLEIEFKKKNIHQILELTVAEAMDFFVAYPSIRKPLALLKEVGLDYIRLGQPASTLSGGESQRLKIAKELSQIKQRSTLYILDEPTTGLHFQEVQLLLNVLHKLVDGGGSVIVVEHNLDVIASSDYVIDLGPEAGTAGGQVVFAGTPQQLTKCKKSHTGRYLKAYQGGT